MQADLSTPRAAQRSRTSSVVLDRAVGYVLACYPCFEAHELTPKAQGKILAGHLIIVSIEGGCFYVRVVVQFDGQTRRAREDEVIVREATQRRRN